jgi:hypothetical protein
MLAGGDRPDARDDVADGAVFQEVTLGAHIEGLIEHALVVVHRQKDDTDG